MQSDSNNNGRENKRGEPQSGRGPGQGGAQWDESAMPSAETEPRLRLKLLV